MWKLRLYWTKSCKMKATVLAQIPTIGLKMQTKLTKQTRWRATLLYLYTNIYISFFHISIWYWIIYKYITYLNIFAKLSHKFTQIVNCYDMLIPSTDDMQYSILVIHGETLKKNKTETLYMFVHWQQRAEVHWLYHTPWWSTKLDTVSSA